MRAPCLSPYYWTGNAFDATSAPTGIPWLVRLWHKARRDYLKRQKPTTFSGGTYWVDFSQGSDSNDGLDGLGFNLSSATFTAATKTLTKTNAFSSYTPRTGDQIYIKGGTAVTTGLYTVVSKTDGSNIVLSADITTNASNPTDVSSATGPYLTIEKLRTASKLSANNVNVKIASGADRVYRYSGASNGNSASGDATAWIITGTNHVWETYYPTNKTPKGFKNPRVTTFTSLAAAPPWVEAVAGTRYTFAITASSISNFKAKGDNLNAFVRMTSTSDVEAVKGSFYFASNTLHVHFPYDWVPTSTPLSSFEYVKNTTEFNGLAIEAGVGYFWLDGIDFDGFGAGTSNVACYPIHSYVAGTEVCVIRNSNCTYGSKHEIGHTSATSGGIMVVENCGAGWSSTGGADTPYVSYATNGDQEWYGYNNRLYGGVVPAGRTALTQGGCTSTAAFTSHCTSNSYKQAMCINERMRHLPSQFPCNGWGGVQHSNTIDTDETECTAYFLDCVWETRTKSAQDDKQSLVAAALGTGLVGQCPRSPFDGARNDGATPATWSTWYDACDITFRNLWGPKDDTNQSCQIFRGFVSNSKLIIDGRNISPKGPGSIGYALGLCDNGNNTEINAWVHNSHIHFLVPYGTDAGVVMREMISDTAAVTPGPNSTAGASRLQLYDSLVTFEGNSQDGTWYLAINPATAANIGTNAWGTGTYKGLTSGGTEISGLQFVDWKPGQIPSVGDIDCTPTPLPSGAYLAYDAMGRPRRSGTTAKGPIEAQ